MSRSVLFLLGGIHLFVAASMLLPLGLALAYAEAVWWTYLAGFLATLLPSLAALRVVRHEQVRVPPRAGLAAVALGWFLVPLFAAVPWLLSGEVGSLADCYFESVSGFTTTGSSVIPVLEPLSRATLFWRAYIQWMGGMGIVLVTVAVFSFLGGGANQLYRAEVPGLKDDRLYPRIATVARTLWLTYLAMTVLQIVLLAAGGMGLFDAVCHAFTTMATGGYSTRTASVAAWPSPYLQWVMVVFMFLAGANFSLHATLFSHRGRAYLTDPEFRFYLLIVLGAAAAVSLARGLAAPLGDLETFLRQNVFTVVTVMTTTGYANTDYELWNASTQFPAVVLVLLMFVGGMGGSTGGGIKVVRFLLLLKLLAREILRLIHPRGVQTVKLAGRTVPDDVLRATAALFFAWMLLYVVAVLLLALLGQDAVTSLTAVAATLNNVGPGFGTVGPAENYAHLPAAAKWILSFCMIAGRLEVMTVLAVTAPAFWRR